MSRYIAVEYHDKVTTAAPGSTATRRCCTGTAIADAANPQTANTQIVGLLADGVPHSTSTSERDLGVHQSTLSHHFKALREARVTVTIVDGRSREIQLRRAELDAGSPGCSTLSSPPPPET